MKRKGAIVKDQLRGFKEALLAIEHDKNFSWAEKSKVLLGVQTCMYVFTRHLESRDAEAFRTLQSATFKRIHDAREAERAAR